jgi:hypothetical protein
VGKEPDELLHCPWNYRIIIASEKRDIHYFGTVFFNLLFNIFLMAAINVTDSLPNSVMEFPDCFKRAIRTCYEKINCRGFRITTRCKHFPAFLRIEVTRCDYVETLGFDECVNRY